MTQKTFRSLLLISGASLALAACQTTGQLPQATGDSRIDAALARAAHSAEEQGNKDYSVGYLEKIYKRNPEDEPAAVEYAAALREADYLPQAEAVLEPFATSKDGSSGAKREYAAVQLELGQYEKAEKYAQQAILLNDQDYKAYHYLGIALDTQGQHPQAEKAFRKGLDLWVGDPTPIMNNLALNLAAQGYVDEAVEILQKAKMIAPDRIEVERNLRIVTALQQSQGDKAPKPSRKPQSI